MQNFICACYSTSEDSRLTLARVDNQWRHIKIFDFAELWVGPDTEFCQGETQTAILIGIGPLFNGSDIAFPHYKIPDDIVYSVEQKDNRFLLSKFWGGGLFLFFDKYAKTVRVLRQQMPLVKCFYIHSKMRLLLFSHLAYLTKFDTGTLTINWKYIAANVVHPRLAIEETGFSEIKELISGNMIRWSPCDFNVESLWSPAEFVRSNYNNTQVSASAEKLRSIIMDAITAWSRYYGKIVLYLSGGLDSSIVLAALTSITNHKLVGCLNYYDVGAGGDERKYASLAAAASQVEISFVQMSDLRTGLFHSLGINLHPKPTLAALTLLADQEMEDFARNHEANAICSGSGGDIIFFSDPRGHMTADFMRDCGLSGLVNCAMRNAQLGGRSLWSILGTAIKYGYFNCEFDPLSRLRKRDHFLDKDTRTSLEKTYFKHPWLRDVSDIPMGKILQIYGIADSSHFSGSYGEYPNLEQFFPLLSLPIIEFVLSTPSYQLVPGCIDRGLAREAFKSQLPNSIVRRRSKAQSSGYVERMASKSRGEIIERLVDGHLASQNIIDTQKIKSTVARSAWRTHMNHLRLLECAAVEHWLDEATEQFL